MKGKRLLHFCFLISIISVSCRKESVPGIVGTWYSESFYEPDANGKMNWVSSDGFTEFFHFYPDGRFVFFIDTPGAGGTYFYDRKSAQLTLNYESDRYGNTAHTQVLIIENVTSDKLIITYFPGNLIGKTKYVKYD